MVLQCPGGFFVKYDFLDERMLRKLCLRIPTAFRKSDYTKAVIKCLVFAFFGLRFSADPNRGEIKRCRSVEKRRVAVQAYGRGGFRR